MTPARVIAVLDQVADAASATAVPDDAETARRLLIAAMAADQELLALAERIHQRHAAVRPDWERWRKARAGFDPAGEPPPNEPDPQPDPDDDRSLADTPSSAAPGGDPRSPLGGPADQEQGS